MQPTTWRTVLLWFCLSICSATAIAATENFANAWPSVAAYTKVTIEVGVLDERPYVKSGGKSDTYVGATRSLYGIPFNMSTTSELPLAKDIETAVIKGFENSGIDAVAAPREMLGALRASAVNRRLIVLTLKEWMIDRYVSAGFSHDVQASVYDANGQLLGNQSMAESTTVESPVDAGRKALGGLLNSSAIATALSHKKAPPQEPAPTVASPSIQPPSDAGAKSPQPTATSQRDELARLEKLKALRERNLIDHGEYERKRKEILDAL
jgi:hypothetical protein